MRACFGNWRKHIVDEGFDILPEAIAEGRISKPESTICLNQLPKHKRTVQYFHNSLKVLAVQLPRYSSTVKILFKKIGQNIF